MAENSENILTSESIPVANRTGYETLLGVAPCILYTLITVVVETTLRLKKSYCFLLEVCTIIIPVILGMTILANRMLLVFYILLCISIIIILSFWKSNSKSHNCDFDTNFITNSRSAINLISITAILAVDFSVFPFRFEKTETQGYSLMDTGVGFYIFANGIISPESRGVSNPVLRNLKGSLPLFIIGGGRFVLTKIFNYHVPVSEYGVHWNFFITLGITKLFTSFFLNTFDIKQIYINAIMLLLAHEMLLTSGLQKFVFDDFPRDSFVKQNKEGLVSSIGFVTLYLIAVYFGYILKLNDKHQSTSSILKRFLTSTLLFLFLSIAFQQSFGISRRVANAAYICWISFLSTFMIGLFYCLQVFLKINFPRDCVYVPYIFNAINYNGLLFFLVANVLTGCINMSMKTKYVSDFVSFFIILGYMLTNCSIVCFFYDKGIKVKL